MIRALSIFTLLALAGCGADPGGGAPGVQTAALDCVTVGGGELQAGLTLGFGATTARVTAVQVKDGDPASHVGFTLAAAPGLRYIISAADGQMFCGDASDWMMPTGTSGPAIDSVDFCVGMSACP
jgi:hypothetical protein